MSVDRRIIGVPAFTRIASTAGRADATLATFAPLGPTTTVDTSPLLWKATRQPASPVQSAAAVRARNDELARVKQRVLDAGGESRRDLTEYLTRYTAAPELPWERVFGAGAAVDVRSTIAIEHTTLVIDPSDVALASLRPRYSNADRIEPTAPASGIAVIAAISNKTSGNPVGFYVQTLVNCPVQGPYDYLDFAVINPNAGSALGVGQQLTALADNLASAAGSLESRLKTAWVGRYYWAQKGYDFATPAERDRVVDYFERFVKHMKLDESKLFIEAPGGPRRPFSWQALEHSWDIAHVGSTDGPVEVPGLVASDQTKQVSAAVGKAFYLGDWGDAALGQNGANLFVRNWHGVRKR